METTKEKKRKKIGNVDGGGHGKETKKQTETCTRTARLRM